MNSLGLLEIVGLVAIILISAFAIFAIIVSVPVFKLINRIKYLSEKLNEHLIPTVEKLNKTVSALNSEINSISDLTQNISSIVEQLEKIIRLARILLTKPLINIIGAGIGLAEMIKKASKDIKENNKKE